MTTPTVPDAERIRSALEMLCGGLERNIKNRFSIINESDAEALAEARAALSASPVVLPIDPIEPAAQAALRGLLHRHKDGSAEEHWAEWDTAEDVLAGLSNGSSPVVQAEPAKTWRCFHCGDAFTDADEARLHFGKSEHDSPACQIDIAEYRAMEERMHAYNAEDSDMHREIYRMQSDHRQALIREEERGYAKALKDTNWVEPAPVPAVVPQAEQALDTWTETELDAIRNDDGIAPLEERDKRRRALAATQAEAAAPSSANANVKGAPRWLPTPEELFGPVNGHDTTVEGAVRPPKPQAEQAPSEGLTDAQIDELFDYQRISDRVTFNRADFREIARTIAALSAPPVEQADARDAVRWRWLVSDAAEESEPPIAVCKQARLNAPGHPAHGRLTFGALFGIDAEVAVDAAIAAASPKPEGGRDRERADWN